MITEVHRKSSPKFNDKKKQLIFMKKYKKIQKRHSGTSKNYSKFWFYYVELDRCYNLYK